MWKAKSEDAEQVKEEIDKVELAAMMDDLTGSEYDLKGLSEFKTLLLGD